MKKIILALWIIETGVIVPTSCPAVDSRSLPFPLPLSLNVGQGWTYSTVSVYSVGWNSGDLSLVNPDTLQTGILDITVVERHQTESQVYFTLSDIGIYRVDEEARTWQYDPETDTETLLWDIWGPPEVFAGSVDFDQAIIQGIVLTGENALLSITRYGPYERHEWDPLFLASWNLTEGKLLEWEVEEFYKFDISLPEDHTSLIFAPNVGILSYQSLVGYVEGTTTWYVLETYDHGGTGRIVTAVKNVSFGQLKGRVARPSSNVK